MASPIVTNKNINVHLNGKCQAIQKFNEVRVCVNGQYSKALKILKKKNGTEFSMLYARLHMYLSYIRTKFYKIPCRGFIGVTLTNKQD